jgi:hypothetical protein
MRNPGISKLTAGFCSIIEGDDIHPVGSLPFAQEEILLDVMSLVK